MDVPRRRAARERSRGLPDPPRGRQRLLVDEDPAERRSHLDDGEHAGRRGRGDRARPAGSRGRSSRAADGRSLRRSRRSDLPCPARSEEHTSELQSLAYLVCRLLLEKKKKKIKLTSYTTRINKLNTFSMLIFTSCMLLSTKSTVH